jgi:uncharacterized protein YndB with AHSA1/START domain
MAKTLLQTATFRAAPEQLFRLYMDPRRHAAVTGMGKVMVSGRPGSRFKVGGHLRGRMLAVVPGRLIVQTWRGADWKKSEPDSVLTLAFEPAQGGARVRLVQANVPARHYDSIVTGWPTYYWKRWKEYLKGRKP